MIKRRQPVVYKRQVLIFLKEWIQPGQPGAGCVPKAKRVKIDAVPDRVWTLYRHENENEPPQLPFHPVHHHNAFIEDYMHDWNERKCKDGTLELDYASRAADRPVWVLLEYKE